MSIRSFGICGAIVAVVGCAAPVPTVPTKPAIGSRWLEGLTGMEFVWVPGGCFQMGSSEAEVRRGPDERQHEVCIDGLWVGRTEVTNGQFRKFRPDHPRWFIDDRADGDKTHGDQYPVVRVSWTDARDFADWLSRQTGIRFRLPTEAEWEYSCRGINHLSVYCGAGEISNFAWWRANGDHVIHRVASKSSNSFGLADMSGNVWEWTCSAYEKSYKGGSEARCAARSDQPVAYRGGTYHSSEKDIRGANRNWGTSDFQDFTLGFRLVREHG